VKARRIFFILHSINHQLFIMKLFQTIILSTFISLPIAVFSQNGFIEIETRDSVQLKAVSFEYAVTLEEDYEAYGEQAETTDDINEMKNKDIQKMKLTDLENFLKNKKYSYTSLTDSNFDIKKSRLNLFGSTEGFKISLKSVEELKKLTSELKQMDKVAGTIVNTNYEDESQYETSLLKRVIDKAKGKAQLIASNTNQILGKIIEVREVKESENANLNFMDLILKYSNKTKFNMSNETQTKTYYKAFIIKFKAD